MVGQINVLIALTDIEPGDGPTVLIPGSHKSTEVHPQIACRWRGKSELWERTPLELP